MKGKASTVTARASRRLTGDLNIYRSLIIIVIVFYIGFSVIAHVSYPGKPVLKINHFGSGVYFQISILILSLSFDANRFAIINISLFTYGRTSENGKNMPYSHD